MCFLNECDWTASVSEESDFVATIPIKCNECYREIKPGEKVYHLYQQEAEECKDCDEGECKCEEGKCCQCETPNIGETFDYDCCEECRKFLDAVEAAEIEAGCRAWEARPSLCGMIEEIQNGDADEAKKYFKVAVKRFPELKVSGYLGRLWNRMFV